MKKIDQILIVGGGSSGWITAAYLAKQFASHKPGNVQVTLVESSDVPVIGVGEAGIPTLRLFLQGLGIPEQRFLKACAATFKTGIKFEDWKYNPGSGKEPFYFHPFQTLRARGLNNEQIVRGWLSQKKTPFAHYMSLQAASFEAGTAPKRIFDKEYEGFGLYSYHFDAGLLVELLKDVAKENGAKHLIGHVVETRLAEDGSIASVVTKEQSEIKADLFIDSTGFAAHLIEKEMGSEFTNVNDILFVDRAVTVQTPYDKPDAPIPNYTHSKAQENGWTWTIPLQHRMGNGYVYSSRYTDETRAEEVLRAHVGPAADDLPVRHLKMRVGYRKRPWIKNCVAVGLSSGFLEPLESTGLYLSQLGAEMIAHLLPRQGSLEGVAAKFNALSEREYRHIIDFIKLHYCLTQRDDTAFWRDNTLPESIPDSLATLLDSVNHRVMDTLDIPTLGRCFGLDNYHYILYGMNHRPQPLDACLMEMDVTKHVGAHRDLILSSAPQTPQRMPMHRQLIEEYIAYGPRPELKPQAARR